MLIDEIRIGLAIFSKKYLAHSRNRAFKCCLSWSNSIFDQQFELKPEKIDVNLNRRIFRDYLKSPNGKKDKRKRSLMDVIAELDALPSQTFLIKVFEVCKEKA